MKTNRIAFFVIFAIVMTFFVSCTLFIDDEFGDSSSVKETYGNLPSYSGPGYDSPITYEDEYTKATCQMKKSTMNLKDDSELFKHIIGTEEYGSLHSTFFDDTTPVNLFPKVGQVVICSNLDKYKYGLCDEVISVDKKDGKYEMVSIHTDSRNAFEQLDIDITPPLGTLFTEYEILDENDSVLMTVKEDNITEASANESTRNRIRKIDDVQELNWGFDAINTILHNAWDALHGGKKFSDKGEPITFDLKGHIKGKFKYHFSFDEISCEPDLELCVGIDVTGHLGMKKPKNFKINPKGRTDAEKEKWRFVNKVPKVLGTTGIVIVPDVFFTFGYQLDGYIKFGLSKTWFFKGKNSLYDADFSNDISELPDPNKEWKWNVEGGLDFFAPIITINIGAGLYQSVTTFNLQVIPRHRASISSQLHDWNPTIECALEFGFNGVLRVEPGIVANIVQKLKNRVKKHYQLYQLSSKLAAEWKEYENSGSLTDWRQFYVINDPNKPVSEEERRRVIAEIGDDKYSRMIDEANKNHYDNDFKNKKMKEKAEEKERLLNEENREKERINNPQEAVNDEEVEIEIGPFFPPTIPTDWKWLEKRYLYPKINENVFTVHCSFVSSKNKVIAGSIYQIKDPGVLTNQLDAYFPGFRVYNMDGSLHEEFFREDLKLVGDFDNEKNRSVMGLDFNLQKEKTYIIKPCFKHHTLGVVLEEEGKQVTTNTPSLCVSTFHYDVFPKERKTNSKGVEEDVYGIRIFGTVDVKGSSFIENKEIGVFLYWRGYDYEFPDARYSYDESSSTTTSFNFEATIKQNDPILDLIIEPYADLGSGKGKEMRFEPLRRTIDLTYPISR